jgi:hypothetical protein
VPIATPLADNLYPLPSALVRHGLVHRTEVGKPWGVEAYTERLLCGDIEVLEQHRKVLAEAQEEGLISLHIH